MPSPSKTVFFDIIKSLLDRDHIFPARYLMNFSDINPADLASLTGIWDQIAADRRISLLSDLENLAESDTLTNFDPIALHALNDPEPNIRVLAIRLLWECEDLSLADRFIHMMQSDPDQLVQAAAASALGSFIYEGELDEIPESVLNKIVDAVTETYKMTISPEVKRRALESLGFSSRDEVDKYIKEMYQSDRTEDTASALFAMGRSADDRWTNIVKSNINHDSPLIQLEAIRAAGELEIKELREDLLDLIDRSEIDEEVYYATIWSLSQIGGQGVKDKFEEIMESDIDDDLADFLENAMDNLAFNDGLANFDLLDLEEDA
jgi:HEAT repeat protein